MEKELETKTLNLFQRLCQLKGTFLSIKKGENVFKEGEEARKLYLVLNGKVKIYKLSSEGKEFSLSLIAKDAILGEYPLFCPTHKYQYNAIATENTKLYVIEHQVIEDFMIHNHEYLKQFTMLQALQIQKQQTKFRDLLLYGKKGALYSTLIRLSNTFGVLTEEGIKISVAMTHQELAFYSIATRESINRMLWKLKEEGIISTNGKYITIKNLQYLRNEIKCENCDVSICRID